MNDESTVEPAGLHGKFSDLGALRGGLGMKRISGLGFWDLRI